MFSQMVYIVVGVIRDVKQDILVAYWDENKAKAFAEKCNKYPDLPPCPRMCDGLVMWDKWYADKKEWWKNYPTHGGCVYDEFIVVPTSLSGCLRDEFDEYIVVLTGTR